MTYPLNHRLGYAPLPRDVRNLDALVRDPAAMCAYVVLLARARHTPGVAGGARGLVQLGRGQCCCGVRELSQAIGRDKSTVDRALKRLEKLGLIRRQAGRLGTVVTICNYGEFGAAEVPSWDTDADAGADAGADADADADADLRNGSNRKNGKKSARARGHDFRHLLELDEVTDGFDD